MSKKTLYNRVVAVCNRIPSAADDRCILTEQIFYEYGWDDNRSLYENLKKTPRVESIMRAMRLALQHGDVVVSDKERERLDAAAKEALQEYGSYESDIIQQHLGRF